MNAGQVALVGAGPGDPELLTLKAVRTLASADVVLHDDLVSRSILAFAPERARMIAVGKRGGCRSTPQAFIEQLMIREARAGKFVVRLKGGDPFVFGRGGEELAALQAAGIDVEVVPGITSGLAASASIAIPVTHRELAHGVALITGHSAADASEPDWRALVASRLTLVIYMGTRRAHALRNSLRSAGMRGDMPVAIIASATTENERAVASTLAQFVEDAARANIASPAIIVVGEVAGLAAMRYAAASAMAGAEVQI